MQQLSIQCLSAAGTGTDASAASADHGKSFPQPHIVSAEEAASRQYSMEDVVLPLPGRHIAYPSNDTAQVCLALCPGKCCCVAAFLCPSEAAHFCAAGWSSWLACGRLLSHLHHRCSDKETGICMPQRYLAELPGAKSSIVDME